jgi:hypothetical protein
MAYGVYWRKKGDKTFKRASELVTAKNGKFKGGLIPKDLRFETIEAAQEKVARYESRGCEAKIKEVK